MTEPPEVPSWIGGTCLAVWLTVVVVFNALILPVTSSMTG